MYSVTDLFIYSYKKKEKEKEENIVEKKNCCGRTDGHQSTPSLNDKIDSGKSHLQDLARWWRTSQGVDIPKISQFYWALFEKTRFLCFYIIKSSNKRAKIEPKYP